MAKKRIGKIEKEIGVIIEPHEAVAADALALNGFDILFIKPRNTYKTKTPDFIMAGVEWELKSPTSSERTTVRNIAHKASKQSRNLVIDTMRTNLSDDIVIGQLEAYIAAHRSIHKVIVITKRREMIVLKGKL